MDSGPDLIAFETIPNKLEAQVHIVSLICLLACKEIKLLQIP